MAQSGSQDRQVPGCFRIETPQTPVERMSVAEVSRGCSLVLFCWRPQKPVGRLGVVVRCPLAATWFSFAGKALREAALPP